MSVSIEIPEELYEQAVVLARDQKVSVDQVFASAFMDQMAVWQRLQQRARDADHAKYLAVLDEVPDIGPADWDRL